MRSIFLVSTALLTAAASAQSTIVSPAAAATAEGNSNNGFPFNSATVRRYTQIHSDIGGQARAITKLSFRQNAGNTLNYTGTWACDMEMFMGDSVSWDATSWVMSANYIGPRAPVFARRVLNMGPQGQNSTTGPLPFTVDIPLDAPHTYSGARSLIWEAVVHSNTLTGSFNSYDAHTGPSSAGSTTVTGAGCIATGRTTAMTHTFSGTDRGGPLLITSTVSNGPSSAPTILALGITNPNLSVPGLCAPSFTDLALTIPMGTTSATGAITGDSGFGPLFNPNLYGGATLYSQTFSIDTGRTDPIQLSASNGRSIVLPFPSTVGIVQASRLYNSVGGTTATTAGVITSAQGYAVVTQFTY